MASFVSRSSSEIPIDLLEAVLPKLGINIPISKILKAVNEEQAKRRVMPVAGATKPSSKLVQDLKSESNAEPETGRHPNQLAKEFDKSFPDGKMPRLYSDDASVESHTDL